MSFHADILEVAQRRVLEALAPVLTERGFYLVGGTAVALLLGHRRSVDLDFFTADPMGDPLRLARDLRDAPLGFETGQTDRGTLHGTVGGVRVSLLEYRYPLLQPLDAWPAAGARLAAPDDLACMKLSAIAQRGAKKDFLDLYALGARHRPLPELLALYRQKYATDDIAHLLYALAYFDDADAQRTPVLLWDDLDWPTARRAVRRWVEDVAG